METLIKCSRVLYDNDISDKINEITNLEKQLNIPKVIFKDMDESTEKTDKLKEEITNEIKVFLDTNWIRLCNQHCDEIYLQDGIEEILFKFTKNIMENKKIEVFNHGNHQRDFTYIDDVVKVIYLSALKIPKKTKTKNDPSCSLSAPFQILNVGGGTKVKLMSFIKEIEKNLKIKSKIKFLPIQKGDVKGTSCDVKKLKKYLNFVPKVKYKIGIKKFIEWFKFYYK